MVIFKGNGWIKQRGAQQKNPIRRNQFLLKILRCTPTGDKEEKPDSEEEQVQDTAKNTSNAQGCNKEAESDSEERVKEAERSPIDDEASNKKGHSNSGDSGRRGRRGVRNWDQQLYEGHYLFGPLRETSLIDNDIDVKHHISPGGDLERAKEQRAGVLSKADLFVLVDIWLGNQTMKTKVINSCLNPVWNEEFTFSVTDPVGVLNLEVFDRDRFKADDKMGRTYLNLQPIASSARLRRVIHASDGETMIRKVVPASDNCLVWESSVNCVDGVIVQDVWLRLCGVESGEIELKLKWVDLPSVAPQVPSI
ncbi:hypothetical protein NE237_002522 [Protea cynaroides]|uniref:C2 domain-containing protein n=1 Tax=Protea cynaroides TaxID=273540 RepID=A0A9Q0KW25_9MAGN|nr:hypothetical protein NE237_002522 [Protea cynaroides]